MNGCPAGKVYDAGLCYDACEPGYKPFATMCNIDAFSEAVVPLSGR